MKHLLLSSLMLFFITFSVQSQYTQFSPMKKDRPFTGFFSESRYKAKKIHVKIHNNISIFSEYDVTRNTSTNGLTDTWTSTDRGYSTEYRTYSPDEKLTDYKSISSYPPYEELIGESYIYDEQGRILEINSPAYKSKFYYTDSGKDSLVRNLFSEVHNIWIPLDKTIVIYTDSGFVKEEYTYIFEENRYSDEPYAFNYVFDSLDRIIRMESLSSNKKILSEYFDGGYRTINYESASSPRDKHEYFFNDQNELTKVCFYFWGSTNWSLDNIREYTYFNDPSSNIEINESMKVYGSDGHMIIESGIRTLVFIYSTSGSLIKQAYINTGINQISMTSGIYIVSVNGKSYKILVK